MTPPTSPLPADVLQALRQGDPVKAIKLLRAATGLGLKEAKGIIDGDQTGFAAPAPMVPVHFAGSAPLPAAVEDALRAGSKIDAIRLLREQRGLGLKEAKDAVDAAHERMNVQVAGLSPGEVPPQRNSGWKVAAIVIAVLVGYYFIRG